MSMPHQLSPRPGHSRWYAAFINALESARQQGFRKLQLDVLSDNSAVHFCYSMGLSLLVEFRTNPSAVWCPPEWRIGINLE